MRAVYSPRHLGHEVTFETVMGAPVPANEVAERIELIRETLEADGGFEIGPETDHGTEPILAVHHPGLLRFLEEAWPEHRRAGIERQALIPEAFAVGGLAGGMDPSAGPLREPRAIGGRAGFWAFDTSSPIVAGTYDAARAAVDVALTTADLVLDGAQRAAYGLCRPPGHHAARAMYGGYCYFNNAAIAAEAIVRRSGEPVAILDLDFHHGNGTQQIFWRRGDVLYASLHGEPDGQYPYYLGRADERGDGAGAGTNLNVPLPPGTDNAAYLAALQPALDAIASFGGSVIVVSLGFDTYAHDPICDFALTTEVYHEVGSRVAALGRRLVILQEGGYYRPALGENARAWLRGAEGRTHDPRPAAGFTPAGTRG
ncbi:MAG TPA: histone deacetylase family protein [Candidatus Limnocylindrales bacterium]